MFWTGELIARTAPIRRRVGRPLPASPVEGRAIAAYLGMAIGDALGATVEFLTPNEIRHKYGTHRQIVGGGWLHLKPGQVTDDTTMALALGEAILKTGGKVEALACAQAFDDWMRRKPVDIGNTVRRNLVTYRRTGNPIVAESEHDAGNGAAMRLLPAALATYGLSDEEVIAASRQQAHVTHNNPVSDAACETLTFLVHDLLAGKAVESLRPQRVAPMMEKFPVFFCGTKRRENPSGYVVETVQAAFQAFFNTNTFEDCLVDVVNRGGDADTTGAIAGMLAGARYGLEAIPARWIAALDPVARQACETQAKALIALRQSNLNLAPTTLD